MRALLFFQTLNGAPVEVTAGRAGFELDARGTPLELPFAEAADPTVGGDGEVYVVLRFPALEGRPELHLDRREPGGGAGQLRAAGAPPELVAQVEALERLSSVTKRRRFGTASLVLIVLLVGAGLCLINLRGLVVSLISPRTEAQLGKAMVADELGGQVKDPVLQAFVDGIAKRLLATRPDQPYTFELAVVRDPTPNAFAAPGGVVIVNTGLIELAETPEQVAGVLGHEVAHVLHRHTLNQTINGLGTYGLISLLTGGSDLLTGVSTTLIQRGYGRAQERDADLTGVQMLQDAGIDPHGLGQLLAALERWMQAQGAGAEGGVSSFLSTHPATAERVADLKAAVDALPKRDYQPIECDWAEVKRRAAAASKK
ncbi:MAG: M48 family metallopeptidase [Planctomycetota bacterium]